MNDPLLDDTIEMAKRFRKNGVDIELLIIDNKTPHGFLNLQNLSDESNESYNEVVYYLQRIIYNFDLEGDIEKSEFMRKKFF